MRYALTEPDTEGKRYDFRCCASRIIHHAALMALAAHARAADPVRVGSKIDTEGSLLGNVILQVLNKHGVPTVNKIQLGNTQVVRGAITAGELDIYPEYTGNGAFFFNQAGDAAWKNAKAGYEKVKKQDAEKTSWSG